MSSDSLSLKYRPKKLDDIIGQEVAVQILKNSFKKKNWHHAYLLAGNLGCGKTSTARIMAAMENCKKAPTLEPCGVCKNCKDIFSGNSLDVREMDAASNRSIDDIRDIRKQSHLAPMSGKVKYYILDESHSLTGYAAQAALKFIEEPPENVRIILATTDPQKIIGTIHSRCIVLNFSKISWIELYNYIKHISELEVISIEDNALKYIARTADGSARNVLQNLQRILNFSGDENITSSIAKKVLGNLDDTIYYELLNSVLDVNVPRSIVLLNKTLSTGVNIKSFINGVNAHLRKILLIRLCEDDIGQFNLLEDEIKKIEHQAKRMPPSIIFKMMDSLIHVQKSLEVNLDAQIYLEKFIIESIIEVVRNQKSKQ